MIIRKQNRPPSKEGAAGTAYIAYIAIPSLAELEPPQHDTILETWLLELKERRKIGYYILQMVRKTELNMARRDGKPCDGPTHQLDLYELDSDHDYDTDNPETLVRRVDWPVTEPLRLPRAGDETIKRITRQAVDACVAGDLMPHYSHGQDWLHFVERSERSA